MTAKTKIIFFGAAVTITFLLAYFFIRPGMIEKEYIDTVSSTASNIGWLLNSFDKDTNLKDRDLARFKKAINARFGEINFLAIADTERKILNRTLLDMSNELNFSLVQNFEEGKILKAPGMIVRNHNQKKYYIFSRTVNGGHIITAFPFSLTRKACIKLILEVILLILFAILIATILYVAIYRKGKIKDDATYRVVDIGAPVKHAPAVMDDQKAAQELSNFASETLSTYVFDLFKDIANTYSPDIVSLYIMSKDTESIAKSFEMRGHSFLKIDSDDFDSIEIGNEVGRELKNASTLVLDNGKRAILPVMYRNSLLGALELHRGIPFNGPEIADVKTQLGNISRFLSEYIFFKDVAIDEQTGLYSRVYFNLKLREQGKRAASGSNYAVMMISQIGDDTFLDETQHVELIRISGSKIAGHLREDDILCRIENYIAILLPDITLDESIDRANKITAALSSAKIKMLKNLKITPVIHIGIASTENLGKDEDMLSAAHQHLELAKRRGESYIQYSPVRNV